MVDILALALSHGLIALAVWRLLRRADLDCDPGMQDRPDGDARPSKDGAMMAGRAKPPVRGASRGRPGMIVPGAQGPASNGDGPGA